MPFLGSKASFSLMRFFTTWKATWLIAISSYCLALLPAKLQQMSASAAKGFCAKILHSQKNSLDLKENRKI